jgi:hypothetical protein
MKRIGFWTVMVCLSLAAVALAQVAGTGTPGTIAQFTSPSTVGNSPIVNSNGNIGIGTSTPIFPLHVLTSNITPPPGQSNPIGLWVDSEGSSDSDTVIAIEGLAGRVTGKQIGVHGSAFSPDGTGVVGQGGQNGVIGATNSTNKFATGVSGVSEATSGGGSVGVFGSANSPDATAAQFANVAGGDIIVGGTGQPIVKRFRVDGHGTVFADGGFRPFGADFAESLPVKGDRSRYEAGDLLVIDSSGERRLALAQTPYSTLVAGIYSSRPGVLASQHHIDDSVSRYEVPLAVLGVVPCKVTAENGPIIAGDLLVTSSTRGYAMKGTDRGRMLGAVVGKALEPLQKGTGVIQVLVTLQ